MTVPKPNPVIAFFFGIIFFSYVYCLEGSVAEETIVPEIKLSLLETTRLALANNFDIQLIKYDIWISRTRRGGATSIYDTLLEADINYENDQSKQISTIFGTKSVDNNYNVGLSKHLPTGTTLSVGVLNHRSWTNAPFATSALTHNSAVALSVDQALGRNFFGLRDRGDIRVTQLDIEAARFTSVEKIEAEVARVQKAYWDLVLAIQLRNIAAEMLAQAKTLHQLHQDKLADGLTELPELYAAEANYRARLAELAVDENEVKTAGHILKLLLNLAEDIPNIVPDESLKLPEEKQTTPDAIRLAFANRRDYQASLTEIKKKGIELDLSANDLWPEIDFTASLARNGLGDHFSNALNEIPQEDNPQLFAGLKFSFPLENTKARSGFDKAKLEKEKALLSLKFLERKIAVGVADRVRETHVFFEQARSREEIAELQRRKLAEEEKRFRGGRSKTDTIIRFQEDLLRARWEEAQAAYRYQLKLIDLKKEQGTLLSQDWSGEL